jgi:hypothetical protein
VAVSSSPVARPSFRRLPDRAPTTQFKNLRRIPNYFTPPLPRMLRPKPTVIVLKPEEIESARNVVIPSGESDEKLKKSRSARLKL